MTCIFQIGVVLLFSVICTTFATLGVDVSTAVSTDSWRCLKNEGYNFAIVRVYLSIGRVDSNGAQTVKNAREAGIPYVDGYIFPCQPCGDPKQQVRDTINHLHNTDAKIGQLWLDVEGKQYWTDNKQDNVNFIQEMVDEAKALGVTVAMYTSASQWGPIAGTSEAFKDLQLWYAHYDDEPNFNDFRSFGGWIKPAMKQFVGTTEVCGVGVDKNWYP